MILAGLLSGCYDKGVYELGGASRDGDVDRVNRLLDNGVDVNGCVGYEGCDTAIIFTAQKGRLEVVRILIARGADLNMQTPSPLYWAAVNFYDDMVFEILKNGGKLAAHPESIKSLREQLEAAHNDQIIKALFGNVHSAQ